MSSSFVPWGPHFKVLVHFNGVGNYPLNPIKAVEFNIVIYFYSYRAFVSLIFKYLNNLMDRK